MNKFFNRLLKRQDISHIGWMKIPLVTELLIQYRRLMEELPDEDKRLLIEQMDQFAAKYPGMFI